jgi:hypothetical protein
MTRSPLSAERTGHSARGARIRRHGAVNGIDHSGTLRNAKSPR